MAKQLLFFIFLLFLTTTALAHNELEIPIPKPDELTDSYTMIDEYMISIVFDKDGNKVLRHEGSVGYLFGYVMSAYIDLHPDIAYIEMFSGGGIMMEVFAPGQKIFEKGIPVKIKNGEYCLSACGYLALYSPDITIDGQMGFHLPYLQGFDMTLSLNEISQSSVMTTLALTSELFNTGWALYLYGFITEYSDLNYFVVFEDANVLNRFRIETADLFISHVVEIEKDVDAFLRTGDQVSFIAITQKAREFVPGR